MSRFIQVGRQQQYLLQPSIDEWLPENHLARFIAEVIDQLDLSRLAHRYTGRDSAAHHPSVLLALLVYGYATGIFPVGRLSARRSIRWHSAFCRPIRIPITTG